MMMRAAPTTDIFSSATRELVTAREELDASLLQLASADPAARRRLAAHVRDVRFGPVAMTPDGSGLLAAVARTRELTADVLRMLGPSPTETRTAPGATASAAGNDGGQP